MKNKPITGRLAQKNGKYHMVLNLYDNDGKRKQKWIGTGLTVTGNKRKAEKMLREELERYESLCSNAWDAEMQLSDWMGIWLKHVEATIARKTTVDGYRHRTARIVEYFRKHPVQLRSLTSKVARDFFDDMLANGNFRTGKPLSPRTVSDYKCCLNLAIDYAIDTGILKHNPIRHIKVSNIKKSQMAKPIQYLTKSEAEDFIRFCQNKNDPLKDIVYVAIVFGLRREECLGLQVDDVDLKHQRLYVRNTVTQGDGIYAESKTKTYASNRVIPLTDKQVVFFKKVFRTRAEWKEWYGSSYNDRGYLFCKTDGTSFRPDYLYHHTKKLLAEFGKPNMTFHDLRHSTASMLHAAGVSIKEAQAYLGHEDPETTLKIYTHFETECMRKGLVDLDL